ncbi:nuclear receptor-binding protein homolog [Glossina fuscipes]|uniref:Nuclear receptor-binding protein homolog n=1 Tax=Glossina fuscipes TaxID=7396 RepID=A0A9C5ZMC9_9MUSC|nr:nuclear receptor-binding protein homolog [Glossina fuscipes]
MYEYRLSDVPSADKLEKFVEDVKFGVYPLTAFSGKKPPHFRSRAASPERADSVKSASPEPVDIESRRIVNMMCSVKKLKEDSSDILMTILLRMDDKMNRQLSCAVTEDDNAADLTQELVRLGFVHIEDQDKIQALLEETLRSTFSEGGAAYGEFGAQERTFSATINEQSSGNGGGGNNNSNNNTTNVMLSKAAPGSPALITNQHERNWSVADTDASMAMLQNQNLTQMPVTTITSPVPPTAAAAAALGLSVTLPAMVTADPLAGTVMYVPHEQLQLQQQHQQHHSSFPQHQQQHSLIPNTIVSMDVVDTQHRQQQQQRLSGSANHSSTSLTTIDNNSPTTTTTIN